MSGVTCSLFKEPNRLSFTSTNGKPEVKEVKCVLDGTLESKTIRLFNHLKKIVFFPYKIEKDHISFLIEGRKVLVRVKDLNEGLKERTSALDIDEIRREELEKRIKSLGQKLFPRPSTENAKPPVQRPNQKRARVSNVSKSPAPMVSKSNPPIVQSTPQEKISAVFQKYGLDWNEMSPESLRGRVGPIIEEAKTRKVAMSVFFKDKIVGVLQDGKLLVGEITEALSEGSNGDVYAGVITVLDQATGKSEEKNVALKMPKSHVGSKEVKREWRVTLSAARNNPSAIEVLSPVASEDGKEIQGLLLPLFHGNFKAHIESMVSKPFSERLQEGLKIFKDLSQGLSQNHGRDIIHNDIKSENVFVEYQNVEGKAPILRKAVLGDWSNTIEEGETMTSLFSFRKDYELLQSLLEKKEKEGLSEKENKDLKSLRKRMDVRQFGFFIHEVLGTCVTEVSVAGTCETEKVLAFSEPYPLEELSEGKWWPMIDERYTDLPKTVPAPLRKLVRDMLNPDESKVPSMREVADRLNQMNF